ncbi:MAG TPA: hypothetical protein VGC64_06430, partial [Pyrinomonadaceae bacterium]
MKRELLLAFCLLACLSETDWAIDFNGLEAIGPVTSATKTASSFTFNCRDNSQVLVRALAPDLVRVRVSFGRPFP